MPKAKSTAPAAPFIVDETWAVLEVRLDGVPAAHRALMAQEAARALGNARGYEQHWSRIDGETVVASCQTRRDSDAIEKSWREKAATALSQVKPDAEPTTKPIRIAAITRAWLPPLPEPEWEMQP